MKKTIIVIVTVIGFAGAGFFYFRSKNGGLEIDTTTVEAQTLEKTVTASGDLETKEKADLSFEVTGKVASVSAQAGDNVKKFQTIAYLDTKDLQIQLNQAKANLDRYVEQRKEFFEKNKTASPSNELFAQFAQYDANVRNAKAQVEAARLNLQKATITAPLDGIVTEVNVKKGELVKATTGTVVTVADLSPENIYFLAEIDEEDLKQKITVGEIAKITLDAAGDSVFKGTITKLATQTTLNDAGDPVLEAEMIFHEALPIKYKILGLSGDADIITEESTNTLVIPIEALIEKNGEKYVWKIVNGYVQKTPIETGLETEFEIAVTSGLSEGDTVATDNLDKLEDGQQVKVEK